MSRGLIILIAVLCAALAALLFLPKFNKDAASQPVVVVTTPGPDAPPIAAPAVPPRAALTNSRPAVPPVAPAIGAPTQQVATVATGNMARLETIITTARPLTNFLNDPELKPLPVLEKDYLATTNREARLDLMLDITENPTAEAVKTLTRLFSAETDPDLKVDLVDSLLSVDGHKEEKLIMLTLAIQQGLPDEVRQSAIDGLIDLDDMRVLSLLNGLLNDPNQEIRESAQDAIDLVQSPPAQVPKLK